MSPSRYLTALDDPLGWRYGSGCAIYTERFIDGRLLCASYVDNGLPLYTQHEQRAFPAFDLMIDGDTLDFGWECNGFSADEATTTGTLLLHHSRKPVQLTITTQASGHGFFRRTMTITNTSPDTPLSLTAITPLCGILWSGSDALRDHLRDNSVAPFSLGHFADLEWGHEGNFAWQDLPLNTEIAYASRRGRSGHNHPFMLLRNNIYGGYFLLQLGWSGNWKTSAFCDYAAWGSSALHFTVAPTAPAPMRVISPGETISAPDVHFGLNHEDFDAIIQRLHAYQQEHVLYQVGDGRQPIIYNHWGYMEHELNETRLIEEIDIAREIGAELFMVDAGWFGNYGASWAATTGDWQAGDRLPNDLFPVFDYARQHGMGCGLWVEIESAGMESKLAKSHPEWFIARYGHPIERILDLAKPAVQEYVESNILRLIDRYQLEMFRLDYNVDAWEGGFNDVHGRQENTLWRHQEVIYSIFDRVKQRYPALQLENCSSGGGRTDVGIVSRFTTTWISDWMHMPRTVRILNGMSMVLPPAYLDRLFGVAMEGGYRGNVETQLHVIILAHPTISGITPALAQANPVMMAAVKKYLTIYRDFIRPFHRTARVYHHTPVIPGADGSGWCALEYAAPDGSRAVAGVFRLVNAGEDTYHLCFRGLNPELTYRITSEPGSRSARADGYTLMTIGMDIRLDTALTSRLLLVEAVE